jgi:hypothetical protein
MRWLVFYMNGINMDMNEHFYSIYLGKTVHLETV